MYKFLSGCGMASWLCLTGFCIASLGVECPHWTFDGSGMATVGVQSVCLLIRMCGMSSVGVACLQCVWHVLCGCGLSSLGVP